jgi:PAS domain S-box-containing protein
VNGKPLTSETHIETFHPLSRPHVASAGRSDLHRIFYADGRALIVLPGCPSPVGGDARWTLGWQLCFSESSLDSIAQRMLESVFRNTSSLKRYLDIPQAQRAHWENRFRYLQTLAHQPLGIEQDAGLLVLRALLRDITLQSHCIADAFSDNAKTLSDVLSFIEQHYHEPITLECVARALSFSPAYLTDLVRRKTGLPIHRWIVEHRLAEAKRLLLDTQEKISFIAAKVGFSDVSHFCRLFSQRTGLSPRAWRKSQRAAVLLSATNAQDAGLEPDLLLVRTLVDEIPQLAWAKDADGNLVYANKQWYAYTGLRPHQSAGWGWLSAVHPDDVNRCLTCWSVAIASRIDLDYRARLLRACDGGYRWHLLRTNGSRMPDGSMRWFGTATDVHEFDYS